MRFQARRLSSTGAAPARRLGCVYARVCPVVCVVVVRVCYACAQPLCLCRCVSLQRACSSLLFTVRAMVCAAAQGARRELDNTVLRVCVCRSSQQPPVCEGVDDFAMCRSEAIIHPHPPTAAKYGQRQDQRGS